MCQFKINSHAKSLLLLGLFVWVFSHVCFKSKFKDVLEFDLELSFHFFQKKSNKSSLPGVYATLNFHNVDESIVLFARGGPRYTHQRGVRVQHARRQCDHRW